MDEHSPVNQQPWTPSLAADYFGFRRWGGHHFTVDDDGFVTVDPMADGRPVRIADVIQEARSKGIGTPLTIRFQDLLRFQVEKLNKAFLSAIEDESYGGTYRGVYPIKVNQLREVVEEILDAGQPYHFGIEAGSKPELMIALAYHEDPQSLVICNGYKDDDYISMALFGRQLGKEIFLVIEQMSELDSVIRLARETGVEPLVGFRVKLTTSGEGKWAESSGESAKFGLNSVEIVQAARRLKRAGLRNSLRLLHFHIGSQVPNIRTLNNAVNEAARTYCELTKMGFPMRYLDVGGGLGIDYDGSRSNFESSMNYTMEEYARDVVFQVKSVCDAAEVPVPDLVSESGRAIVAPHSLLIVDVFDRITREKLEPRKTSQKRHKVIADLVHILHNPRSYGQLERFHDAQQKKEEALQLFTLGFLDLETRAEAESLYWQICQDITTRMKHEGYQPEELHDLKHLLSDQYVCNFSVFQSLLDHWACEQLFPIAPIHRLDERPTVNAFLVDITCDSEGKIDAFIDLEEEANRTIPLHPIKPGQPYYLGIFLVGAYQDIMGDLHNLFGRVNEVHVFLEDDEEDGHYIEETIHAFTTNDILELIQYRKGDLARLMKKQVDKATREDTIKPREGIRLLEAYENLLKTPTYLQAGKKRSKAKKRAARATQGEAAPKRKVV